MPEAADADRAPGPGAAASPIAAGSMRAAVEAEQQNGAGQLAGLMGSAVSWQPTPDEAGDPLGLPPPEEWHRHPALLSG